MKMDEDGLVVMRGQPLHQGHIRLIRAALSTCERVFLVIGSTQEFGTSRNPFTFGERKKMVKNYFNFSRDDYSGTLWERINVIGLPDINSPRWPSYVLDSVKSLYPDANIKAIFGGSQYDCDWFKEHKLRSVIVDRTDTEHPYASASMLRDMLTYGDPRWMSYVPYCNWHLIAKKFNRLDMIPDGDLDELWQA